MMIKNYFKFLRAGINTKFQDLGRENLYHIGIPFQGTINFMNKTDRTELLSETIKEFERWDRIRNENWLEALPELECIGAYRE